MNIESMILKQIKGLFLSMSSGESKHIHLCVSTYTVIEGQSEDKINIKRIAVDIPLKLNITRQKRNEKIPMKLKYSGILNKE